ncbi:hypothetical protein [Massilia sp. NP310]|uniref:hypothetical protein n=1 Tax=Massilia sp. NP310 TaxID=2861282 RepID=UPI001C6305FD|nr:hypothetical protein [Massilia sp. NP310]QYG02788.1 hypothetical protein KY496_05070 [Massilia sp. NP310]
MKNTFLILLMFLLPWQTISAAERNFEHMIGSGQSTVYFVQHFTEHVDQILHHHNDDDDSGGSHQDDTKKSLQHLADVDHGFSINVLLPASPAVAVPIEARIAPSMRPDTFYNRTTLPPIRPPRASF